MVAVNLAEIHAGRWSYTQGSTRTGENDGETDNLRWMLYLVCAVLSFN